MGYPHLFKRCPDCGETKSVDEFYNGRRRRDGYCKDCRRKRDRARSQRKTALRYDPAERRDYKLRRLYGITLDDYNSLLIGQDERCAICGAEEVRRMYGEPPSLVVDHNHETRVVRGLLCCACNARLSAIEDEQFMLSAKEYLRRTDGFLFVGDQ